MRTTLSVPAHPSLSLNPLSREARPAVCAPSLEPLRHPSSAPHLPLLGPLLSPPAPRCGSAPAPYQPFLRSRGGWWRASPTEEHLLSVPSSAGFWHRRWFLLEAVPADPWDPKARACPRPQLLPSPSAPRSALLALLSRYCIRFSCSGFLHDPGARDPLLGK